MRGDKMGWDGYRKTETESVRNKIKKGGVCKMLGVGVVDIN